MYNITRTIIITTIIIHYTAVGGGSDNLSHVKHSFAVSFVAYVDDVSCRSLPT